MADIKFEIKETLGAIAESAKGWKKELNIISWNGHLIMKRWGKALH